VKFPAGFWEDPKKVREYLGYLTEKLNIQDLSGWYNVSWKELSILGAYKAIYQQVFHCNVRT
jgi:hypothetical protein